MRSFHFHASQRLDRPLAEVFAFFADARNLPAIMPPRLQFALTEAGDGPLAKDREIGGSLRVWGLTVRWRHRITCWRPPRRIAEEQTAGPYRSWQHVHTFEALPDGSTEVIDYVEYAVHGGPLLEGLVDRLFVRPQLDRDFAWRHRRIAELLAGRAASVQPA